MLFRAWWWCWWSSSGLVVAVEVDDQFAEEFSGGGIDDADVLVLDEQVDVGSADADVAEPSGHARVTGPVLSMRSVRTRSWV